MDTVLAVLDEKKLLKVIRRSLPHCSKIGNSQKVGMNSQKFSFCKPPQQGGCVFETQFRLRLAHRMHLDFQNLITRVSEFCCVFTVLPLRRSTPGVCRLCAWGKHNLLMLYYRWPGAVFTFLERWVFIDLVAFF